MPDEIQRPGHDAIWWGFLLGVVCDAVMLFAMWVSNKPGALFTFGLRQWLLLLPVWGMVRWKGYRKAAMGVLLAGLVGFLLQAACYGLVFFTFRAHR